MNTKQSKINKAIAERLGETDDIPDYCNDMNILIPLTYIHLRSIHISHCEVNVSFADTDEYIKYIAVVETRSLIGQALAQCLLAGLIHDDH